MKTDCLPLSAARIQDGLSPENIDFTVVVLPETDSTNAEAARRIESPLKRTLILADRQTAGRGRLGRSFHSPKGGLYMTALLPFTPRPVTLAAGVAVCEAVEAICGQRAEVKWVNDVYANGKKVCGILTESTALRYLAVGIGVNLSTVAFPPDLTRAGSVGSVDRNRLAPEILNRLTWWIDRDDLIEQYRRRCFTIGQTVSYTLNGLERTARALDIDDAGGLILDNGEVLTTGGLNN